MAIVLRRSGSCPVESSDAPSGSARHGNVYAVAGPFGICSMCSTDFPFFIMRLIDRRIVNANPVSTLFVVPLSSKPGHCAKKLA